MPINITMPALSPTMEEGNLAKWLVKEGDKVSPGDVIAEIETDKATMEVEAVDEGVVAKIVVPAGTENVKVNSLIAVLVEDGEDAASVTSAANDETPKTDAIASAGSAPVENAEKATNKETSPEKKPVEVKATSSNHSERVFASPLARRIAKDAGLDLGGVAGTGPRGRVVKADVESAIAGGGANKTAPTTVTKDVSASSSTAPRAPSDDATLKLFEEGSYELIPHDNMRKTIARRLVEAKSTIPHFYLTLDTEIDALLALRKQLNDGAPVVKTDKGEAPAYKLSVNDLVIKAFALALRQVPDANVSWTDAGMLKHRNADVGVAVSIPGGLITPIVRKADEKSLSAISNEMKDLALRARNRKLKPEEYQGGTTSVSNLGMFGIKDFAAVINPPHATILAVGAGEERAIVRNGQIVAATIMSVTLSTDHRAVDGALGAELLAAFKRLIENPLSMLV